MRKPRRYSSSVTRPLPTYGIGQALDAGQWRSVFRQLVARAYLSVDLERYGALRLEQKCRPLLRGEEIIALRRDQKVKTRTTKKTRANEALSADIDPVLWEALRDKRRQLAETQGVPPYVIFHDKTLREMCLHKPRTEAEFSRLAGVGESKLEKYAEAFLAIIGGK